MVIAPRFKTKKHREEGSFSFHGIGSKKKHSSYFSLYPITGNVDECLTLRKEGRWKLPAETARLFFTCWLVRGLAAPQLIAGEWEGGDGPCKQCFPPEPAVSQVSFLFARGSRASPDEGHSFDPHGLLSCLWMAIISNTG